MARTIVGRSGAAGVATPPKSSATPRKSSTTPSKSVASAATSAQPPARRAKAVPATAVPATAPTIRRPAVPAADRREMIAVAAYHLAEARGFSGGSPEDDWLLAEAQIDALLREQR
jgi:hypothetical protein